MTILENLSALTLKLNNILNEKKGNLQNSL